MAESINAILNQIIATNENVANIDLGNCGLSKLPTQLYEIHGLEELILSDTWFWWNSLEKEWELHKSKYSGKPNILPKPFKGLKPMPSLRRLVISGVSIETLNDIDPIWLSQQLPSLQHLKISDNPQLDNLNFLSCLTKLERLDISNTGVTDLSPLSELTNLQYLHMNSCRVNDLSPLCNLTNLKVLHAEGTEILLIDSVSSLPKLEVLSINGTKVSSLKPIKHLTNLTHLYANKTNIKKLKPLENKLSLITLYLGSCKIKDITPLATLINLENLFLAYTPIKDIESIRNLKNISYLDLSFTLVQDISPLINLIKNNMAVKTDWEFTDGLFLKGCNALKSPPIEIVNQGSSAIIRYFDQMDHQDKKYLYEAKLLIIGEGGAGKTTLKRKLLDPMSVLPLESETTKGIDIERYDFEGMDDRPYRVNIWDFGGQGKYQAAHSFFYTHRSLYILVDDTRTKDTRPEYIAYYNHWLQTAKIFGGDSPLIIFHNQKADRIRQNFNLGDFQVHYSFVKDWYALNLNTTDTDLIVKFRKHLELYIQQLPHIGHQLPQNWIEVREKIESLSKSKPYIEYKVFTEICSQCGIIDEKNILDLSSFFHDLGIFLHYSQNPVLKHYVFLQDSWVTSAIYKVFDDPHVEQNFGRFSVAELNHIWTDKLYLDRKDELLELMKKFELCYQIESTDIFVVPELLPNKPQSKFQNNGKSVQLRFRYEFVPKGLLHRLMVRMHTYIAENNTFVWNTGFVLEIDGNIAEVHESIGHEIRIIVFGPDPQRLLYNITYEIDKMNQSFGSRLKVEKMVPCICDYCEANPNDMHFHKYDLIRLRKEKGKEFIPCEKGPLDDVSIELLLERAVQQITNDSMSGREKIINLVKLDKIEEALDELEYLLQTNAIMLKSKLQHAKNSYLLNILTTDEYMRERSEVNFAILSSIDI